MIADKFQDNPEALKQAGIAYATDQIIDLICNGVKGIHLYTMNKPEVASAIMNNISSIVKAYCKNCSSCFEMKIKTKDKWVKQAKKIKNKDLLTRSWTEYILD